MKSYLIATACNKKYENFLYNHWLKSLRENVELSNIDLLIIDYGLSENIRKKILEEGFLIYEASNRKGLINNNRFIELRDFLLGKKYDQVLICDSGDIIFQSDISHLFEFCNSRIRGCYEEISPHMDMLIAEADINYDITKIKDFMKKNKNMLINVGFLIFPYDLYIEIVNSMEKMIKNPDKWGLETILLNYLIKKEQFCEISTIYNFIPTTSTKKYFVKDGKFYFEDGTLIPVVHNAGGNKFLRPIRNFGYGKEYNKEKKFIIFLLRNFYKFLSFFRKNMLINHR
ncbi:MAG: hypothetical protein ABDH59_00075 [Fervidobacterium sp.]